MDMTSFIIFGLLMSVSAGALIGMMVTVGMNDGIPRAITAIIIALAVGFGSVFLMNEYRKHEEAKWNNGICAECGTEWHFQSAAKGRSSTTYYYICDNGHIFETECLFQK